MTRIVIAVTMIVGMFGCLCKSQNIPIHIKLQHIGMELRPYEITADSNRFEWYYPENLVFSFLITNNVCDTTEMIFSENSRNETGKVFSKLRMKFHGKTFDLYSWDIGSILPNDSSAVFAWNVSLPIFDSVYTAKQMSHFIHDLLYETSYYVVFDWDDYRTAAFKRTNLSLDEVLVKEGVNLPDTFHIDVEPKDVWTSFRCFPNDVPLERIGYPFDKVPSNVETVPPMDGFIN